MKKTIEKAQAQGDDALAFAENKVKEIRADFERRSLARRALETQWQINANFVLGNQHCCVDSGGGIADTEKDYFWQEREVYNHIAPIYETRLAKLGRVRPKMSVRPASADEDDLRAGKVAGKILNAACATLEFDALTASATMWSELCGTAFYKLTWDEESGRNVGSVGGKDVYEGEVRAEVCPPYEIYPSSLACESLAACESLIHARAVPCNEIRRVYGTEAPPETVEMFSYGPASVGGGLGVLAAASGLNKQETGGYCLVIERYTRPSPDLPDGEFAVVAGDKLLHYGALPYRNGNFAEPDFPFVKQDSVSRPGSFFGMSVIERVIPIQRAYNAVKNRKHEFLNRIAMGVLAVEDGSVDTDNLETEGLSPGKILIYRQGSTPPRLLDAGHVPSDFREEEDRLLREFIAISGVSEIMRASNPAAGTTSGVAIQLLIEQDDTRLSVTAEYLRRAIRKAGRHVLRLYKQFAAAGRLSRVVGDSGEVELLYWNKSDISCDDVVFDTENEISSTPAVKQSMMFDLLRAGLLHDENGKLSDAARYKILDTLGYGGWEFARDVETLNVSRAAKENLAIKSGDAEVSEIDRHDLHIAEHIKYALSPEFDKLCAKKPELKERLLSHIRAHKQFESLAQQAAE